MIQQQCYTRERRGLFRNSDGYDSIAKSAGLEDAFIRDHLHPFCFYHVSKTLQAANTPAEAFPKAMTVIRFTDGRMLAGQSTYVAADFTGQRSTFFTHNYVLPPEEAAGLDIRRVLYETAYLTAYDIQDGKELPELSELPHNTSAPETETSPASDVLERLQINQDGFNKIVQCLLLSVSGPKKTFIAPSVDPSLVTDYASVLLVLLYRYLPPQLTRLLSFITYSREPENKKGLHLMFLEKDVVRPGDPRVSRDYWLDFANNHFGNTASFADRSPFLDLIWDRLARDKDMDDFYRFCEVFPTEWALQNWDSLADIYRVYTEITVMETYDTLARQHVFRIVKQYLPKADITRLDMNSFAAMLVLNEAKAMSDASYLSAREIIEEVAGYYVFPLPEKLVSQTLYRYMLKNESDCFFTADLIRSLDNAFFSEFVLLLVNKKALRLLDAYLRGHMEKLPLHALFEEMRYWIETAPEVFNSTVFKSCVCERVLTVMESSVEPITTANLAYQALTDFHAEHKLSISSHASERFILAVMEAIDGGLLPRLDFAALTKKQLAVMPGAFIKRGKDSEDATPFLLLEILKKISETLEEGAIPLNIRYFIGAYHLDATSNQYIIHKLREFFREYIISDQYDNIVFLFRNVKSGLDVDGLLRYIDESGSTRMGAFLIWAVEHNVFNLQNEVHREALKMFIKNHIKDSVFKETVYANAELKNLAREARFGKLAGML